MPKHNEDRLPKWAQETLAGLRRRLSRVESQAITLRDANAVLARREWFLIENNPEHEKREVVTLYRLETDTPIRVCTLGPRDALLVARSYYTLGGIGPDELFVGDGLAALREARGAAEEAAAHA